MKEKPTPAVPGFHVHGFEIAIPGASGSTRILQWSGLSGRRYDFLWRPDTRRHTVRFLTAEEFEKAYKDINHTTRRIPSGLGVFHVHFLDEKAAETIRANERRDRRENVFNRFVVNIGAGLDPLDDADLAAAAEEFDFEEISEDARAKVDADLAADKQLIAERDRQEAVRRANEKPKNAPPVGVRTSKNDKLTPPAPATEIPEEVRPVSTSLPEVAKKKGGRPPGKKEGPKAETPAPEPVTTVTTAPPAKPSTVSEEEFDDDFPLIL